MGFDCLCCLKFHYFASRLLVSVQDDRKKTKGVLWHVSKLLYSLFPFIAQFLSSRITVKQVFIFKVYIIPRVDISNNEIT
jgi:hypothetical protein